MTLNDNDLMPFGKHQGVKMANVPCEYLMWLWENGKVSAFNRRDVYGYIKDNMDVIEKKIQRKRDQSQSR